jgi:hypothetical protein
MPDRLPDLDRPGVVMPDAQRRAALRHLQAAHRGRAISAGLYLSLIGHIVSEHAPQSIWAHWWGQRPRKENE